MELSDSKVLDALMRTAETRRRTRASQPLKFTETHISPPLDRSLDRSLDRPLDRRKRCHCGVCTMCVDNARWETIFNAKFADPDYYKSRPVRSGSSLDWLRPAARHNTSHTVEP